MPAEEPVRTQIDGLTPKVERAAEPADAAARFVQVNAPSPLRQQEGGGESGRAGADDGDLHGGSGCAASSGCGVFGAARLLHLIEWSVQGAYSSASLALSTHPMKRVWMPFR